MVSSQEHFMAIIKRINPKTNEIEFRVRFLWKDADGNRKDSKTGFIIFTFSCLIGSSVSGNKFSEPILF